VSAKKSAPRKDRRWFARDADKCKACGTPAPKGPRSYSWDCHMVGDVMIATCSTGCRSRLALPERKLPAGLLAESLDDLFD
jgi:predicted RNA-binding Zn-ribbon protein involved in translation (DUF1610 family)